MEIKRIMESFCATVERIRQGPIAAAASDAELAAIAAIEAMVAPAIAALERDRARLPA
jgi:hypothetical protein